MKKPIYAHERRTLIKSGAVGVIDHLGYLRCMKCSQYHGTPVYKRGAPHNEEPCEVCGERVADVLDGVER